MENSEDKRLKEFNNLIDSKMGNEKKKTDVRVCRNCGRRLIRSAKNGLCPMCAEQELFNDVRDYIRANDVKDYDVAEKFGLPLVKVKEWIRQGRIQYKDDPTMKASIMGNFCEICGSPLNFGTVCPRCMKDKKKENIKGVAITQPNSDGDKKMRFLDNDK